MASKNLNPQDELHIGHRFEYVIAISTFEKGRVRLFTKGNTHVPDGVMIACPTEGRGNYPVGSIFKCYNALVTFRRIDETKYLRSTNLHFIQKP